MIGGVALRELFWKGNAALVGVLSAVAAVALAAMIVVTSADVVLRQFGISVKGAYDLVRVFGAVALACALAATTEAKGHIAIEYFFHKLKRRGRGVVDTLVHGGMVVVLGIAAWQCIQAGNTFLRTGEVTPTLQLPFFWVPWVMAAGCALAAVVSLRHMLAASRPAWVGVLGFVALMFLLWGLLRTAAVGNVAFSLAPLQIGVVGCVVLLVLLVSSLPVAVAMGLVGIAGFAWVITSRAALNVLRSDLIDSFANYGLTVIPLFVFMGQVAFHAGISGRLYNAAYHWLGWMRGGMAMATVGACAAFGAICGSGPATAATMAAVALPEMRRFGYDDALASGTVAAGGSLGMLIPPSVVFIVYGILTEQSIGKLFIAGIVPGLLCTLLFCITIYVRCRLNPALGPKAPATTWTAKWRSLLGVTEMLLLFALVIGGMYVGWFTPNEGAAIGAAGSVALAAARGTCTWRMLWRSAQETLRTSCMVLAIIAGATMFGHFLAVTQIPTRLAVWLTELPLPAHGVLALIVVFYLIAGCFVDALALILLTIPILYPVVMDLGFDPIWFGVIIVLVTQMGVITPPVGVNVYVVGGMDRSIPLQTIFRGAMPFLLALIVATVLITLFPGLATWLPSRVK